ncbi:MAG: hypothetical protein FD181_2529 [Prolixibacteraceae bacterium]|nr:MAG: hypothetical protein FD181_2529 [Prolixibacteraceae bacterium]
MKKLQLLLITLIVAFSLNAKEFNVAKTGNDKNQGTADAPFLSIQAAANIAQPGDVITVHEGVYREWIKPPRGGESDTKRIVYQAAPGEKVEIKGSEIIKGWEKIAEGVWKVKIPNPFFGDYNPYTDKIHGDWFNDLGRSHHTGDVYLNGHSLWESALMENVLNPPKTEIRIGGTPSPTYWFCESDKENTFIYANFKNADPNSELVEINVRKACFYPVINNVNYITVRGFTMKHAATQWAPPTAEQIGLIGTNWSKGWIIENNIISDSRCSGITLGKYGDEFDNTSEDSAEGYVETIHRAIKRGWGKENIGSHIVRNNTIYNCEQTGICGSLGAIFSVIENNTIYNIWKKRQFTGAEMGGIKIHASIDMLIKNNRLYNCGRGLWLDWMAQGTRVTQNLLYNNTTDDIFVEVNHGPFLIDNNILLSKLSVRDWSQGGAYVHNLFAGNFEVSPQDRFTPYHKPHSTELAGLKQTQCGDNRFYNNIFINGWHEKEFENKGLSPYKNVALPVVADGNVFMNRVEVFSTGQNFLEIKTEIKPEIQKKDDVYLINFHLPAAINKLKLKTITTEILGKAIIPEQRFSNPDGTPLVTDTDFFGNKRNVKNPIAGPFAKTGEGKIELKYQE